MSTAIQNLLVATDLSPRSDRALERAWRLALDHEAHLTVLHVSDEDLPEQIANNRQEEAVYLIKEQVSSFGREAEQHVAVKVVGGNAMHGILDEAEKTGADLIILGTHRRDFLGDFFTGTTVERVIRYANRSVLVVTAPVADPYRRVLVGIDFSVHSRKAAEFALRFVKNGEFFLSHAYDVPYGGFLSGQSAEEEIADNRKARMEAMLEQEMATFLKTLPSPPARIEPMLRRGGVSEVLCGQVTALKSDLLVVGAQGSSGIAQSVLGSAATRLLSDPPCDVLAVKAW